MLARFSNVHTYTAPWRMRNTNNKDEVFGEDGVHSLYFHINIIYYSIQLKGMNSTYMRAIQKEFSIYDHLFVIINTHITLCTTCGHLGILRIDRQ